MSLAPRKSASSMQRGKPAAAQTGRPAARKHCDAISCHLQGCADGLGGRQCRPLLLMLVKQAGRTMMLVRWCPSMKHSMETMLGEEPRSIRHSLSTWCTAFTSPSLQRAACGWHGLQLPCSFWEAPWLRILYGRVTGQPDHSSKCPAAWQTESEDHCVCGDEILPGNEHTGS